MLSKFLRITSSLLIIASISIIIFQSCGKNEPPTIWEKTAKFVKSHSTEDYLKTVDPVFKMLEGEHKASDWVEYFFSVLSTRNWISEDDELAKYVRGPKLPVGIMMLPYEKDDTSTRPQLIVKADDARNLIIVEGYDVPANKVVFSDEWVFPEL